MMHHLQLWVHLRHRLQPNQQCNNRRLAAVALAERRLKSKRVRPERPPSSWLWFRARSFGMWCHQLVDLCLHHGHKSQFIFMDNRRCTPPQAGYCIVPSQQIYPSSFIAYRLKRSSLHLFNFKHITYSKWTIQQSIGGGGTVRKRGDGPEVGEGLRGHGITRGWFDWGMESICLFFSHPLLYAQFNNQLSIGMGGQSGSGGKGLRRNGITRRWLGNRVNLLLSRILFGN